MSEIEFTVTLFSNASMVFLPFSQILCISSYIRGGLSIFVRGHRKVTGIRYVVETLFIILDKYVKLRGLSKKFVEFVNKSKSTSAVAFKLSHV